MVASPWAVLRCQFADTVNVPPGVDDAYFADLFTASGSGTLNMVDYFLDSSHGKIDTGGTEIFGWYRLDQNSTEYTGSGSNQAGRNQLVAWAKQKAVATDGVDFSQYAGVLVCMNVPTDYWGSANSVVGCDVGGLYPTGLAIAMGYAYGMLPSRVEGPPVDFSDPWDAMSGGVYASPHARWRFVGPGLSAANMYGRGWLDAGRTHVMKSSGNAVITLRPLHRRDLPGTLAAQIGDLFVEFRTRTGWDTSLPHPAVLVHTLSSNRSYLMANTDNAVALVEGSVFDHGAGTGHVVFTVENIDPEAETATIRVNYQLPTGPEVAGPALELLGAASADGSGIVFINGKVAKVPPNSPAYSVLEHLAVVVDAETVDIAEVRDTMLREGYKAIDATVASVRQGFEGLQEVPQLRMS
ncbi:hypothetical protein [Streptomyces violascens]|uniref:hypothetical protein n=1 Tax=Streptomyces violascens TaxID=67381 RepID=UPI00369C2FBA